MNGANINQFTTVPTGVTNTHHYNVVMTLLREFACGANCTGGFYLQNVAPNVLLPVHGIDDLLQDSNVHHAAIRRLTKIGEMLVNSGDSVGFKLNNHIKNGTLGGTVFYDNLDVEIVQIELKWAYSAYCLPKLTITLYDSCEFPIECILAAKIKSVLMNISEPKMGDLFDIYCITKCFDFDTEIVRSHLDLSDSDFEMLFCKTLTDESVLSSWHRFYAAMLLTYFEFDDPEQLPKFSEVLHPFSILCANIFEHRDAKWYHKSSMYNYTVMTAVHRIGDYIGDLLNPYYKFIGSLGKKYIVTGECALYHAGLTDFSTSLAVLTNNAFLNGVQTHMVRYTASPWYNRYEHTKPSEISDNILYPTAERALIECIIYSSGVNPGTLIDALREYYSREHSWDKLYEMLTFYSIYYKHSVDCWIAEAESEDKDES